MIRSAALVLFAVILVVICLPAAAVGFGRHAHRAVPDEYTTEDEATETEDNGKQITVFLAHERRTATTMLEDYLVGVVMAEMPASFEMEALKAQAVVARTYTIRRMRSMGGSGCSQSSEHADICTDSTHCQAWLNPDEEHPWWPEGKNEEYLARIKQAVYETRGEVATFQGQLIDAVYHSTCGGQTELSSAVWRGGAVPYLQSIQCPYCHHSPTYRQEIFVSFTGIASALGQDLAIPAAGDSLPLQIKETTPGGRVAALQLSGVSLAGTEVRRLLELPSTAFTWESRDEGLLFLTQGHGHGVGLCQYGADGAAAQGKEYREIIDFYYPGVRVTTWDY